MELYQFFYNSGSLVQLFMELYLECKDKDDEYIIRPGDGITGVSLPEGRYLFYVLNKNDDYQITIPLVQYKRQLFDFRNKQEILEELKKALNIVSVSADATSAMIHQSKGDATPENSDQQEGIITNTGASIGVVFSSTYLENIYEDDIIYACSNYNQYVDSLDERDYEHCYILYDTRLNKDGIKSDVVSAIKVFRDDCVVMDQSIEFYDDYVVDVSNIVGTPLVDVELFTYDWEDIYDVGEGDDVEIHIVLEEKSWYTQRGYTVNARDGLTDDERQSILASILANGEKNPNQCASHLMWCIRTHNTENYRLSREKWKRDLDFLRRNYNVTIQDRF